MSRTKHIDYAGARASSKIRGMRDVRALDSSRWVVQPKLDGIYVQVHTDRYGRVRHVNGRSRPVAHALCSHLIGALSSWPDSVLIGELEAGSDRGNRAAKEKGWRAVHLFDVAYMDGTHVARMPYSSRRDLLLRSTAEAELHFEGLSWTPIHGFRGRDKTTGEYVRAIPEEPWKLFPVVEQWPLSKAGELWDRAVAEEIEGLVLVNTRAKLGASKLKMKPTQSVDGTVVRVERSGLLVYLAGEEKYVAVGYQGALVVRVGDVVEIVHEGRYDSGELKFPRMSRVRLDLTPVVPLRMAV